MDPETVTDEDEFLRRMRAAARMPGNKYTPHQGTKEQTRRKRQMEMRSK